MQALFDHFIVVGSKITARFTFYDGTNLGQLCTIILKDSSTAPSNFADLKEQRNVVSRIMTDQRPTVELTQTFNAKKFFHRIKGTILNDKDLSGDVGHDPFEDAVYQLTYSGLTSASSTVAITGHIDYLVVFHEPHQPPQS